MTGPRRAPESRPYTPTMADLEAKIGIDSLAEMLARRAELIDQVATLRAKYAAYGLAEHLRKRQLSQIMATTRASFFKAGRKVSNDEIEAVAHASDQYGEVLTEMLNERAKWARLEDKIDAIDVTIMRGTALVRFAGNEARL